MIDPTCRRNICVEIPMLTSGVQSLSKDIEPEKLFAQRVPKWPFAQRAFGGVENHDLAAL